MDYSKGKIYLIRNKLNENLIYVGSTIQPYLSRRFAKHKCESSSKYCSLYKYINNPDNKTTWNDWYIELYEEYPCDNKHQLCKRENEIIREKGTINKKGYLTDEMKKQNRKVYLENNKEKIQKHQKIYYENNKEKISEKYKNYYKKNKDIITEKKKEYGKIYYEENKEKISEKQKTKLICICGSYFTCSNKVQHEKSKKHIKFIANNH